ncbi:basic proline-rich protein-like, partial [Pongo abelii]|uniref:basic proline-rich protein-like n=1 Tax=Pongo abelii TaxID=9601 RepID=UPI0023E8744B
TGPGSASQRSLHAPLLASLRPPPVRRACLPAASTGPAPASRRPLSAQLAPHDGLPGPGLSPLAASPGPAPPQVGLSRPSCSLPASSPGPALPPGCVHGPGSCLTATALDSAPAQLLAASVGRKLPQATLSRPSSGLDGGLSGLSSSPSDGVSGPPDFLQWAPLGPAWASRRPLRAQLVVKPASPGPVPASRRPLRAQHVLEWAPPGPAPASRRPLEAQPLPPSWRPLRAQLFLVLLAASTGPTPASQAKQTTSLGSAPARLPPAFVGPALSPAEALQARLLPPGGLRRRSPGWRTAPAGPAPASQGPLRARLSPGLTAASRGQVPACLPAASTSQWALQAHLLPRRGLLVPGSCPSAASAGPAPASQGPA